MIVIDAAALIAGLTSGGPAREAMAGEELHAPELAAVQVADGLGQLVASEELEAAMADAAIDILGQFDLTWHPMVGHLARIWELSEHLSAYDASYVALAEALECVLVTADAHMGETPGLRCSVTVVSS